MQLTFKYRIFPTKYQRTIMNQTLEVCKWVYNETLATRKNTWENEGKTLSLYDTNKLLTDWKKEYPRLNVSHSHPLQEAQERVDLAFKHFFRRVKAGENPGYPRFKQDWYKSFTYKQPFVGFSFTEDNKLRLSKIGDIKIEYHRDILGDIKRLTIKRDNLGNWYACFSCEVGYESLEPVSRVIGIDLGLTHFATFSNGDQIDNPRYFKQDEKALKKAKKKLSEYEKDTSEYNKKLRVVQHIYKRIYRRREDFTHKLSRYLVDNFQIIALEDLDIQNMQKDNFRSMNKSIGDVAWGKLIEFTDYKAAKAGRTLVLVDPKNTTQECSGCGEIVRKELNVRIHDCPHCKCILDRDLNAAINILSRGLSTLGASP